MDHVPAHNPPTVRRLRPPDPVDAGQVWITQILADELAMQAGDHAPNETGGMLVGYLAADDPMSVVITGAIKTGPRSTRKPHRFVPDGRWQQQQLERLYAQSGRIATYLGDWHSHPRGPLLPSAGDTKTARRVARSARARSAHPLTLLIKPGDTLRVRRVSTCPPSAGSRPTHHHRLRRLRASRSGTLGRPGVRHRTGPRVG
jgi:integrative and conjugative element protein (TIGR02256 family)